MPLGNIVSWFVLIGFGLVGAIVSLALGNPLPLFPAVGIGFIAAQSPRIAQQWERGIVLRLGRFHAMQGPGLFWILPFVDKVSAWIDQRTITTSFAAEQDRKSTRLNSSHVSESRMPSSA